MTKTSTPREDVDVRTDGFEAEPTEWDTLGKVFKGTMLVFVALFGSLAVISIIMLVWGVVRLFHV